MRLIERFETIRSPPPWSVICLQMHFHKTAGADSALCCFECYDFSLLASLARLNYKHPSALEHEMWDIQPVAITFNQFLSSTWRNHLIEAEQQKPLESAETAWRGKEFENFQLAAIQKKEPTEERKTIRKNAHTTTETMKNVLRKLRKNHPLIGRAPIRWNACFVSTLSSSFC